MLQPVDTLPVTHRPHGLTSQVGKQTHAPVDGLLAALSFLSQSINFSSLCFDISLQLTALLRPPLSLQLRLFQPGPVQQRHLSQLLCLFSSLCRKTFLMMSMGSGFSFLSVDSVRSASMKHTLNGSFQLSLQMDVLVLQELDLTAQLTT